MKLFKGNAIIPGRRSKNSLYDSNLVSFDNKGGYNSKNVEGFIIVNTLNLRDYKKK